MRNVDQAYEAYAVPILKHLAAKAADESLRPVPDPASPIAYSYPELKSILGERAYLDSVILGRLEKEQYVFADFNDRILLCPYCLAYNVCFRDICPECGSADLTALEMLHHFRCGYIGAEEEFHKDGKLVCPKCSVELLHVGKDYERPSEVYTCGQCEWTGSEPVTSGHCVVCDKEVRPEKCLIRDIKSYRIASAGRASAESGELQPSDIRTVGDMDPASLEIGADSFSEIGPLLTLTNELGRLSTKHEIPLSAMVIMPDALADEESAPGPKIASGFMRSLEEKVRDLLPDTAYLAVADERHMLVVLPYSDPARTGELARKVISELRDTSFSGEIGGTTLSVGVAIWEAGAARLLEDARKACQLSADNGGDRCETT